MPPSLCIPYINTGRFTDLANALYPSVLSFIVIESLFNDALLRLGGAALDSLGGWTVDMVLRDPALIICLLCHSSSGNSRAICANDGDLVNRVDSLL